MFDSRVGSVGLRILACLALVILTCGLKNYLIFFISGTVLCPYLCPSVFGSDYLFSTPLLGQLFQAQIWIMQKLQDFVDMIILDKWKIATSLLFAPVVEEFIYRGPLFLFRRSADNPLWWMAGIGLSVIFALSHGRDGLALFPLIIFGICSLWLVSITHRFWPSIVLHFLYNFFFLSIRLYQSLSVSD